MRPNPSIERRPKAGFACSRLPLSSAAHLGRWAASLMRHHRLHQEEHKMRRYPQLLTISALARIHEGPDTIGMTGRAPSRSGHS